MEEFVTYETFGAVGDGNHNDFPAIIRAHAYANQNGLTVRTKPDAVYYIGKEAGPAVIATHTDWSTSRFIVDDRETEDRTSPVFLIPSLFDEAPLSLPPLSAGQTETTAFRDCDRIVTVTSDEHRHYIRLGPNRSAGSPQTDTFLLKKNGEILSGINWTYSRYTSVVARPVEETELTVSGGFFETVANEAESKYTYYHRGIQVSRSRTVLSRIVHTVSGEGEHGAPYSGFFHFENCALVSLCDCVVSGHKTYRTVGAAGTSVPMGSYDILCNRVVGILLTRVKQDDILNPSLWGVFGSNFCKQIEVEDCILSRVDAHCGVRDFTLRRCTLGHMGVNAIGFGTLLIEDVTSYARVLVNFREDYGCTWDGTVILRRVNWEPSPGSCLSPAMFGVRNAETHDFGYPCTLPREILLEDVTVLDTNTPESYAGVCLFSDFHPREENAEKTEYPFPLGRPRKITVCRFRSASGKAPVLCTNKELFPDTELSFVTSL